MRRDPEKKNGFFPIIPRKNSLFLFLFSVFETEKINLWEDRQWSQTWWRSLLLCLFLVRGLENPERFDFYCLFCSFCAVDFPIMIGFFSGLTVTDFSDLPGKSGALMR